MHRLSFDHRCQAARSVCGLRSMCRGNRHAALCLKGVPCAFHGASEVRALQLTRYCSRGKARSDAYKTSLHA